MTAAETVREYLDHIKPEEREIMFDEIEVLFEKENSPAYYLMMCGVMMSYIVAQSDGVLTEGYALDVIRGFSECCSKKKV